MSLDIDLIYPEFNLKVDKSNNKKVYEFEEFRVDAEHLMLYRGCEEISMAPKAMETLLVLVERRGQIVSKDELMAAVWTDSIVEESNLAQYLHVLRKTLGDQKNGKPFIETLRRRGYRFSAEVRAVKDLAEVISMPPIGNSVQDRTPVAEDLHTYQIQRQGNVLAVADWKRPDILKDEDRNETLSVEHRTIESEAIPQTTSINRGWTLGLVMLGFLGLGLIGLFIWSQTAKPTKDTPIKSVAVLPFVNAGSDPELDYLSDGLSESLIDRLSELPKLKVIARSSSFRYRDEATDLREVARILGVEAIITGRVDRRDDDLVVRVELVDTGENKQLWGEQFDRKVADALVMQREIARTISEKLRLKLSTAETERLARNYTENPDAYQLYLRGHFLRHKFTPQDLYKSIEFYRQAIELDPNFALAYVGLAESAGKLATFRDIPQQLNYRQTARESALKAISLDDQLPEAHAALGSIFSMYDYDFSGAEREYSRALELNPNYSDAYLWRGQLFSSLGRHDDALAEIQRGVNLDPVSLQANQAYGEALFFSRRYDESIDHLKKLLKLEADYFPAHRYLAFNYEMKGLYAERIAESVKINEIGGTRERGEAVKRSFETGGWQGFLRDAADNKFDLHPYLVATLCAELGQKDKAIDILEKLYEQRSSDLVLIKVDPRLDNLRDNARFNDLLRRLGFPR